MKKGFKNITANVFFLILNFIIIVLLTSIFSEPGLGQIFPPSSATPHEPAENTGFDVAKITAAVLLVLEVFVLIKTGKAFKAAGNARHAQ